MINDCTAKAIQVLLDLFTVKEKDILKITCGDQIITLAHQFIGRGGNYKVVAENPFVFKSKAAKILDANRKLIDMLFKIQSDDLFASLLDPNNYKDKKFKTTKAKKLNKIEAFSDSNSANLVKTLTSSLSGEEGLSETTDYSKEWENQDIERLNSVKLERNKLGTYTPLSTEDGQEDHTTKKDGFDKSEDLDTHTLRPKEDKDIKRTAITYTKLEGDLAEKPMHLQSAALTKGRNVTATEAESSSMSLTDSLMRQNFDTLSERITLANAIKNIQNLEFVDIREKLYRKFDPLFYEDKKTCP